MAGMTGLASAQTSTPTTPTTPTATVSERPQGHRPLGQDGVISAINGTTITMSEEADEGGATYTVNASGAGDISTLKVGDKVFVDGAVSGTGVTATKISAHPSHSQNDVSDGDGENPNQ